MSEDMSVQDLFDATNEISGKSMALLEEVFKFWEVNSIGDAMEKVREHQRTQENSRET